MSKNAMKLEWRCWWPFALLCLVAGSRWIFVNTLPEMSSTLRSEAMGCAVAAVIASVLAVVRRASRTSAAEALKLAAIGAGLLAVPAFGAALRGPGGNSYNRTIALCLIPVIVLVSNGVRADADARMTIWPGLAGIGASLMLFPLVLPEDWISYVQLFVPPLLIGGAIVFARARVWRGWAPVFFFTGGAVCLAAFEWLRTLSTDRTYSTHWQGVLIDSAMAWLVMMSARSLDSLRFASRYFLVPLLTILEGVIFLREGGEGRFWLGLIVLLGASVSLWWQSPPEADGLHLT